MELHFYEEVSGVVLYRSATTRHLNHTYSCLECEPSGSNLDGLTLFIYLEVFVLSYFACHQISYFLPKVDTKPILVAVCLQLTGEDGAELGPTGDSSFRGVLAQGNFQEEHRKSTTKQEDEIRDEKCTWEIEAGKKLRILFR